MSSRTIAILAALCLCSIASLCRADVVDTGLGSERLFFSADERQRLDRRLARQSRTVVAPAASRIDATGGDHGDDALASSSVVTVKVPDTPAIAPGTAVHYQGQVRSIDGVQHLFNGLPWRPSMLGIARVRWTPGERDVMVELDDGRELDFAIGQIRHLVLP